MIRDVIVPDDSRGAYDRFHFAQAVRHGALLLCSGQIGMDAQGGIPESPEQEFRNAWEAVGRVLAEAGVGFEHVLEYTSYHVGLGEHLQQFMAVRDGFIQAPWPAWTAIGVSGLAVPGARVEIRVTAAAPD